MIYGIGDLHFDFSQEKPMDIFGERWINHEENIIYNWIDIIKDDDLVILPGDISWALKLNEAKDDLKRINELPGKKLMIRGNHDYWWSSLSKLNGLGLDTIFFLHNNAYVFNNIGIAGTRGWISEDSEEFKEKDKKIFERELGRLRLSLEEIKEYEKKIAIIHYPPFNMDLTPNRFVDTMKEYKVNICLYGHLHAEGHNYAVNGIVDGIEFHCVSSDYIDFKPKLIIKE